MQRMQTIALRLSFLFVLTYSFLYFSYRWLNPLLYSDFPHYYPMYLHPFDFRMAASPWVYRQINAVVVHLLWRSHLYYPNHIQFQDQRYDQHVFFASLLSNYIALLVAALLTTFVMDDRLGDRRGWLSILSAIFCCFTFQLQVSIFTGVADGWSWVLLALGYLFYRRRQLVAFTLAILPSIFQREILPLVFVVIALTELWQMRRRRDPATSFQVRTALASFLTFVGYMVMRSFIFPVPGREDQISLRAQIHHLLAFRLRGDFVFEVFLAQNLFFLLAVLYLLYYRRYKEISPMAFPLLCTTIFLLILSIATGISNSAGRMIALLTPIACIEIASILVRMQFLQWRKTVAIQPTEMPSYLFATASTDANQAGTC